MNNVIALSRRTSLRWAYLPDFAQAQLPRYTSYPPANRFNAEVDATTAAGAISALPAESKLSLYVHVPYCRQLCWYCGCHTAVPTRADPLETYLDALDSELARIAQLVPKGVRVSHIHFGGGSPDILAPAQIDRIFNRLSSSFSISPFAEIAAEFDPRGLTKESIAAFGMVGLSRASLGVQVLDPGVQARINRKQTPEQIEEAIASLRRAGVAGINVDMMYGLPGQTIDHVIETALFAAQNDADRIAVFGYAHVPWFKKHQKSIEPSDLPQGEARFRQAEAAANTLEQAGYVAVGFDHFAAPGDSLDAANRDGRLRRNFQGYTDDDAAALIGFGASAISSLPGLIWQNTPDSAAYRATLAEGRLPIVRGTRRSEQDIRIGRLIERILCEFEADAPADLMQGAAPMLQRLADAGVIQQRGARIVVTERGRPYVRNVAAAFDPEMVQAAGRHSLAV